MFRNHQLIACFRTTSNWLSVHQLGPWYVVLEVACARSVPPILPASTALYGVEATAFAAIDLHLAYMRGWRWP